MRYCCFVICLVLFLGCRKDPPEVEAPECKLASLTTDGFPEYLFTYDGTKIVKVGDLPSLSMDLTYDNKGRLARIERPSENPNNKIELFYNAEGNISMEKNYEKRGPNWLETTVVYFTYTNGKVTATRETFQWVSPIQVFDSEIAWDGDNIRSIVRRSADTVVCMQQYTYDVTQKNPLTDFKGLYYVDYFRPSYKMALYYSASRLTKEETDCPGLQTTNLSYDLSDSMKVKVFANAYEILSFNYACN